MKTFQEYVDINEAEVKDDVKPQQAYEWIKTGHWSLKQFNEWLVKRYKNKKV